MNFENIIEKRKSDHGLYKISLEIAADDYKKSYNELSSNIANEIVKKHLYTRGDDGRPSNVKIEMVKKEDMIRISADIHYADNDYTGYKIN